jgi:hypothetical protein
MVSEVLVYHCVEGVTEQSIFYPGSQEAEIRGYRKGPEKDITPKDTLLSEHLLPSRPHLLLFTTFQ